MTKCDYCGQYYDHYQGGHQVVLRWWKDDENFSYNYFNFCCTGHLLKFKQLGNYEQVNESGYTTEEEYEIKQRKLEQKREQEKLEFKRKQREQREYEEKKRIFENQRKHRSQCLKNISEIVKYINNFSDCLQRNLIRNVDNIFEHELKRKLTEKEILLIYEHIKNYCEITIQYIIQKNNNKYKLEYHYHESKRPHYEVVKTEESRYVECSIEDVKEICDVLTKLRCDYGYLRESDYICIIILNYKNDIINGVVKIEYPEIDTEKEIYKGFIEYIENMFNKNQENVVREKEIDKRFLDYNINNFIYVEKEKENNIKDNVFNSVYKDLKNKILSEFNNVKNDFSSEFKKIKEDFLSEFKKIKNDFMKKL